MYRWLFLLILFPVVALAHQPVLVEFERYQDTFPIVDPELSKAFYGVLSGFPHTYQITIDEPLELRAQVLVPDIDEADDNRGAIIVRLKDRAGVAEVARLKPKEASWESFYEPWGGDSYRSGPEWSGTLEPGTYFLEVNTAINLGKYVFVVGEFDKFSELGYFATVKRIYQVKKFFGKPGITLLQSPVFTIPFLLLLTLSYFGYRRYQYKTQNEPT